MNSKLLLIAGTAAVISSGCGSNEAPKEVVVTDTVVKTETVTVAVPTPVDSAAVVAYYEAAHAKAKGAHQEKHVAHAASKKKVRVDSHQPVEHHDAVAPVSPATAPAATSPAPEATAAPATTEVIVVHDTEMIYYRPDEKASFPGGEKAFDQYLIKNMKYPDEAARYGKSGTVHAIVNLDETGKVVKVDFVGKELGLGLENEARRLLMNSPRWNPAKHQGTAVKSKFAIPITFEFEG